MGEIKAVNNIVLDVDLSTGHISEINISNQDRRRYLGGKGLALKLLHDHIGHGIEPLSPDNILVMMSGPTAGTSSPAGSRFAVVGKSPLTGIFASSIVGGRFGLSLKKAGYDGILVRGKAKTPVYIKVDDGQVSINDASSLWGMDTYDLQDELKGEGDWVVIGPAGENLVRYAAIVSGRRLAARSGLGAVMGSKNLKGIVAKGTRKVIAADPELFAKAVKKARYKVRSHINTGTYLPELGTPQNVRIYGANGIMPVRNFSRTSFDKMENISAEKIRDEHFVKNHGCAECPIQCGRTGKYNGREMISPEYETIGLIGSNLMVDDLSHIAAWNEKLNRLGMDSISTGSVIAFAMELTEKGLLSSSLAFGKTEGIDMVIEDIAYRRGFGEELAEGVKRLSEKYGGKEYAIHVKGLEMAAYDPRGCTGQGLGYATANMGATHLSGSTHAIEVGSYLSQHGTKGKAHFVKAMQDITDAVNSAVFCIQTEYAFLEENFAYKHTPMWLMRIVMRYLPTLATATVDLSDYSAILSGLLGYTFAQKDFYNAGERIFTLERLMNCREGISRKDDTLPERLLTEVREDSWPGIELDKMLNKYYELREWDDAGYPKEIILKRLGVPH
jgi:aldehyde:ferredoxin oxidoreductase